MAKRSDSDEHYVLNLCDELLGIVAQRQYASFDFLRGDAGHRLRVDAYYEPLRLVIEYFETQHSKPTPFFDKPERLTISGVSRGEQRRIYDQRRRDLLPQNGIHLLEINYTELEHHKNGKLKRSRIEDLRVLREKLARCIIKPIPDDELWLHQEPMQSKLAQALKWASQTEATPSDLMVLENAVVDNGMLELDLSDLISLHSRRLS